MGLFNFFRKLFGRKEDRGGLPPSNGGKGLIVAINDYPSAPLQGCIQDASSFQLLWTEVFGIDPKCIRMILNKDATTENIKDALKWLADVKSGEFALYHFSGHGVQVPGKESDGLCEAICPYDFDWRRDRMLTDDDFFSIFWEMPDNVRFYWTSDSCHSGDLSRDMLPFCGRNRSMPLPPNMVALVANLKARRLFKPLLTNRRAQELDVGFVSACQSNQTAADTVINGRACGAFSYYFCEQLRRDPKNPMINVVAQTVEALKRDRYSQVPQGEGPRIKFGYLS
jgi:hypothetical protein